MAVLTNEYKKIQYLIDSFVLPFIRNQHPKWTELILTYLKFLDENSMYDTLNITDNVNVNVMFSDLLDDFLNIYFKDVIDLNKFGLNDDNKRLFIALSKLIHNLKSTKTSYGFFFNSLTDFSIPSDSGDINVNDLVIELQEKPEWWLLGNEPTRPFTYIFKIDETELTNLKELIKEVHPAGFLQLFLYEVDETDYIDANDCLELDITYGTFYNGKYDYDAVKIVEGVDVGLYYDGGYTISELYCSDEGVTDLNFYSFPSMGFEATSDIEITAVDRLFTSTTDMVFDATSDGDANDGVILWMLTSPDTGIDNFFDNTYWSPLFGSWATWDGSEWDSTNQFGTQALGLEPLGGWESGYDPISVDITLGNIGGSDTFDVAVLFDNGSDVTVSGVVISDGVPYSMDLTSGGDTINRITLLNSGTGTGTFSLTDLVWYRF